MSRPIAWWCSTPTSRCNTLCAAVHNVPPHWFSFGDHAPVSRPETALSTPSVNRAAQGGVGLGLGAVQPCTPYPAQPTLHRCLRLWLSLPPIEGASVTGGRKEPIKADLLSLVPV